MPGIIPKEKLAAYRRWEAVDFDEDRKTIDEEPEPPAAEPAPLPPGPTPPHAEIAAPDIPVPPPEENIPPAIEASSPPLSGEVSVTEEETLPEEPPNLPTAADIERMYAEAHQQGYSAGHDEGIAAAKETAASMETLMAAFRQALAELDQRIAEQLLATSIGIADQVMRQSLRINPELLLPVVIEAINALHPRREAPTLTVHPDDAAMLRENLNAISGAQEWEIVEDASITRGGCRVESGAAEVDATLETRWRRVIESIGIDKEWLDNTP
ncbi:MAG: flagellar assembly protein FliH [Candidatus Accumulibacter sp.]|jgi:flagellar assembly protein FliH|nr:flagellar assembly protein FliH [Accumulibacter sp.]